VAFRRRQEHRDLRHRRDLGRCQSLWVGHKRRIHDPRATDHPFRHLARIGQLRNPLRIDEAGDLDGAQAAARKRVDERDLVRRRHQAGLVLQAIAWPHLEEDDVGRQMIEHGDAC
jgi:hypothetical protein